MPSKSPRCPECGDARVPEFAPFCSRGCRDRDLLKWFGENYRIPVNSPPDGDLEGGGEEGD